MRDWLLALLLGALGIVIVVVDALGWYGIGGLWTFTGIIWVGAALRLANRPHLVVMGAGVVAGLCAGGARAFFVTEFVGAGEAFWYVLIVGILWGIFFAGITWSLRRIFGRPARVST